MKKKNFLITTNIEKKFTKNHINYFVGDWCLRFEKENIKGIVDKVKEFKPIVFGKEYASVIISIHWNQKSLNKQEWYIENLVNALYTAGYTAEVRIHFPQRNPHIQKHFVKPKKYRKIYIFLFSVCF